MDTKVIGKMAEYKVITKYESEGRIFMEGSIVDGALAEQRRPAVGGKGFQHRKVIAVKEGEKAYAIPVAYVIPASKFEENVKGELKDLTDQVGKLVEKGETEGKKVLEKKYLGFTGKQIAIGALILLLLLKIK
jgi:hypothetical protein